ncbi:MAG TPA: hypothetical protein VGC79_32505 [Polyangiaceae bacterium]
MDSSLDAHFNNAAPVTNGADGAGTTVRETKLDTSDDTAGLDAGAGAQVVGGGTGEASGAGASQVSVSKSESN